MKELYAYGLIDDSVEKVCSRICKVIMGEVCEEMRLKRVCAN